MSHALSNGQRRRLLSKNGTSVAQVVATDEPNGESQLGHRGFAPVFPGAPLPPPSLPIPAGPPGLVTPPRPQIELPGLGRPFSTFAREVGMALRAAIGDRIVPATPAERAARRLTYSADASNLNECFLCFRSGVFGRVRKVEKSGRSASSIFFERIGPEEAVTELERWIEFVVVKSRANIPHSMKPSMARTLIASHEFIEFIPRVDRLLEFSIPIGVIVPPPPARIPPPPPPKPFDPFELGGKTTPVTKEEVNGCRAEESPAKYPSREATSTDSGQVDGSNQSTITLGSFDPFDLGESTERATEDGETDVQADEGKVVCSALEGFVQTSAPTRRTSGRSYTTLCFQTIAAIEENLSGRSFRMAAENIPPDAPAVSLPAIPSSAGGAVIMPPTAGSSTTSGSPGATLIKLEPGFGQYREKTGEWVFYYCDRFLNHSISLSEAEKVLENVFEECGLDGQNKTNAIARLLTPHCQGLMGWRKRSPLWAIVANQPRSGKDYMAMIAPIVHSHYAVQDPPLEEDEEVKRRITTALLAGRRFMHFANCRKDLDNPSLEAAVTAEYWSDRTIGSSSEQTVANEIMFSLSYNGNLPLTRDIAARMCVIRIFRPGAAANKRVYKRNLHAELARFNPPKGSASPNTEICRKNVLAALDTLICEWASKRAPLGGPFASYPEWAEFVGGIMIANKLGDPCKTDTVIESMTGANDWDDDLLTLAKAVCGKAVPGAYLKTRVFTNDYILCNRSIYPAFIDYFDSLGGPSQVTAFNIALTKFLHEKLEVPLSDGVDTYRVERNPKQTIPHFRFKKATSVVAGGTSSATPPATPLPSPITTLESSVSSDLSEKH